MKFVVILFLFLNASVALSKDKTQCPRQFLFGLNSSSFSKSKKGFETLSEKLIEELKSRSGCRIETREIYIGKGIQELNKNAIDGYAFAIMIPEMKPIVDPVNLYSTKRILLVNKHFYKSALKVEDYLGNSAIKFSVVSGGLGFVQRQEIDALDKAKRVEYTAFPESTLELLANDKVQATFISMGYYSLYKDKMKLEEKVSKVVEDGYSFDIALWLSKKRVMPNEKKYLETLVQEMRDDGTIQRILLKFISEEDFKNYYRI
jgi:hypothetical protein